MYMFQVLYEKQLTKCKTIALIEVKGNKRAVVFADSYKNHLFRIEGDVFIDHSESLWTALKHLRNKAKMYESSDGLRTSVSQFKGCWVVNIRRVTDSTKGTSDGFCVSADSVEQLTEALEDISNQLIPAVQRVMQLPTFVRVLLYVMYVLIEKQVQVIAKEKCLGCTTRGQFHRECEASPSDKMAMYFEDALGRILLNNKPKVKNAVKGYFDANRMTFPKNSEKLIERFMSSYILRRLAKSPEPPSGEYFQAIVEFVCKM